MKKLRAGMDRADHQVCKRSPVRNTAKHARHHAARVRNAPYFALNSFQ